MEKIKTIPVNKVCLVTETNPTPSKDWTVGITISAKDKIVGWTEEPKVFTLSNDVQLFINNEGFEPYKAVFERQDIDVSVFEPEMVMALERIACKVA